MNRHVVKAFIARKWRVDPKLVVIYLLLYLLWGISMDWFGTQVEIARFTHWWQVITVYWLYMIPISLLLRGEVFHRQYAYGLVAMAFLEFGGYALETSYAYPDNLLDHIFGIRNFSLAMALFFALYFPAGNWLAQQIYRKLFSHQKT